MNNNGKSNIIFIILIPIFFVMSLLIVDTFVGYTQNKKYKKITENIITEVMNNDELYEDEYYDEIKRLYELNGYDTEYLVVDVKGNTVKVDNEHSYFGIISSIKNNGGKDAIIKIFSIDFKVRKSSKIIISAEAKYNYDDELEIIFIEEK